MSQDPYKKFFKKAQEIHRPEVAKPRLKVKPRVAAPNPVKENDLRLRGAVRMKKAKPPVPWKAVGGLIFTLVMVVSYALQPQFFENLYNSVEIRAMGQATAADAKPAQTAASPAAAAEKSAAAATEVQADKSRAAESGVSQEFSHFEKLKQRKDELDMRENELSQLEEELQKQKVELDKRILQLESMRNQIAQTLKDRVEVDQEKVTKLVDLYTNMKPKQAADVIGTINEDLAVEVLAKMKKKNAAEIMNLLSPEKARVLSEKYTGYRRGGGVDPKG